MPVPTPGFATAALDALARRARMFQLVATQGETGVLWGVFLDGVQVAKAGRVEDALETALRAVEREA